MEHPLRRSASKTSIVTTLSMITIRVNKYQTLLSTLNVVILLSSMCLMFFGAMLIMIYHMDKLGFGKLNNVNTRIEINNFLKNFSE